MPSSSPLNDTSRPKIRSAKRYYSNLREYKGVEFPLHDLSVRGAHAIGIGRKYSGGKPTGQLALRYYVVKLLRVVAYFTEVHRLHAGDTVQLVAARNRDEDYAHCLEQLCRRTAAECRARIKTLSARCGLANCTE